MGCFLGLVLTWGLADLICRCKRRAQKQKARRALPRLRIVSDSSALTLQTDVTSGLSSPNGSRPISRFSDCNLHHPWAQEKLLHIVLRETTPLGDIKLVPFLRLSHHQFSEDMKIMRSNLYGFVGWLRAECLIRRGSQQHPVWSVVQTLNSPDHRWAGSRLKGEGFPLGKISQAAVLAVLDVVVHGSHPHLGYALRHHIADTYRPGVRPRTALI